MYAFEYLKPGNLKEAAAMLAANPDGKFVSGGHTLLPAMKLRLAGPSALVDLNGLGELRGIRRDGDKLVIVDEKGSAAAVETADVTQSNGVVHVIDSVLLPK